MAMMDRELSKTNIGQSFEKQSKPAQKKVGGNDLLSCVTHTNMYYMHEWL